MFKSFVYKDCKVIDFILNYIILFGIEYLVSVLEMEDLLFFNWNDMILVWIFKIGYWFNIIKFVISGLFLILLFLYLFVI